MKQSLTQRRITTRMLSMLCAAVLILSLLPLYAISCYNHAYYDDFGYTIRTRKVWQSTGSIAKTLTEGVRNTLDTRQTWEGNYASTFLNSIQPALFNEALYYLTSLMLLSVFLLSLLFFLRRVLIFELRVNKAAFGCCFCAAAFVMIQFVPDASEAFFWYAGGMAYTLLWSLMLLRIGVWLKFDRCEKRGESVALYSALLFLTLAVGGSKFSTVLFALLIDGLLIVYAFVMRRPKRTAELVLTVFMLACFVFCAASPGNAVRSATLGARLGVVKSVLQAFYFGLSLMGQWFSLPLAVLWALAAWMCAGSLQASRFSFKRPVWVTLLCVCLFCAQLAPTIYTGNYIGDGRTRDTYYYTYVLMSCALVLYWEGWFLRRREKPLDKCGGIRLAALIAALVVLAVGCVSYHPEGSLSYGPQNMTSGSALRSLLSGQAARYDAAMDARDSQMNDASISDAELTPVNDVPPVFMGDALTGGNLDYVLNLYAEYYGKQSVRLAEEEGYASQE